MIEYRVVYRVNGEGYTKELPWVDCETTDEKYALERLDGLKTFHKEFLHQSFQCEEWIEARKITEWTRVDLV
jgi:hypothetical protein